MQTKPKAKSIDALSDRRWQNTFVWRFVNAEPKPPKKPISNRTANILIAGLIIIMSVLAVGITRELYIKVIEKECTNWQTAPLDEVDSICIKRFTND